LQILPSEMTQLEVDIEMDNLMIDGYYSEYDKKLVEEAERYGKPRSEES
jgi:hypothetical protein